MIFILLNTSQILVFSHAINNNKNKYKTILLGYWYLVYTDFDTEISQDSHVWSVLGLNAASVCVLDRDRSKPIKFLSGRLMETCFVQVVVCQLLFWGTLNVLTFKAREGQRPYRKEAILIPGPS